MINVHACGGEMMMRAAVQSAEEAGEGRPLVLGVTVLTSMDESDLQGVGVESSVPDQVLRQASLSHNSGLDGVVFSAREVEDLREHLGKEFKLVVPGIRPQWASSNDQKRIVTPATAIAIGADYLVIGRPITGAGDPVEAANRIAAEIAAGV
jgi:orotidine-5'-phosphate decarboxylase